MSDEHSQEDQPGLTYGEAWEIQRTVGPSLNHHEKCSSVPGHHPLSGPALLCDCGVIERFWNHRRFTKLQREIAEVTKQRDALVGALVSMKQTEPSNHNGDLFYPRHSPDGDYLGEEPVDPIALLGGLYTMINEALASVKGGSQ